MILNQAIVFDDETLASLEGVLKSKFVGENVKTQIRKACQDYRLLKKCLPAKGLVREVIFFLLDPASTTIKGVQSFFDKLQIWVIIVPEWEQQLYHELVLEYYEPSNSWDEEDISQIRDNLISVILELQPRPNTSIPMQIQPGYEEYDTWMTNYGSDFDTTDSSFNIVPDLKADPFVVYSQKWEVPTLQD